MGQTAKTPRENRTITVDFSVEVEDGVLPTPDWLLNLQILTSGGYRYAPELPHHSISLNV